MTIWNRAREEAKRHRTYKPVGPVSHPIAAILRKTHPAQELDWFKRGLHPNSPIGPEAQMRGERAKAKLVRYCASCGGIGDADGYVHRPDCSGAKYSSKHSYGGCNALDTRKSLLGDVEIDGGAETCSPDDPRAHMLAHLQASRELAVKTNVGQEENITRMTILARAARMGLLRGTLPELLDRANLGTLARPKDGLFVGDANISGFHKFTWGTR